MLDREHRETLYRKGNYLNIEDCAEVPPADKCVVEVAAVTQVAAVALALTRLSCYLVRGWKQNHDV